MERKSIHSVGIDIGTTTTQLIFSRLTVVNRAPASQVPVYEFIERAITYQSPVSLTPIDRSGVIDANALQHYIHQQIEQAGAEHNQIETGAIIITGETAKADNAREALLELSEQLGDFVVATAGPNLESVIAGRGSGAQEYSHERHKKVLNIDIGGGTSNFVVFNCGQVSDTACLNIGGRLVETTQQQASYFHKPALTVIEELFGEQLQPRQIDAEHLRRIADRMAQLIIEVAIGQPSRLACYLLQTPMLSDIAGLDAIFLSGGVGDCFYQLRQGKELQDYNDIGPQLARALLRQPKLAEIEILQPSQTIRATVIGAGAYSLALSGSTIWLNTDALPLKNIPVVHPNIDWQQSQPDINQAIQIAAQRMDLNLTTDHYAIAIDAGMPVNYRSVLHVAAEVASYYQQHGNRSLAALVISHNDIGKALGMELQPLLPQQQLCVIDEVITNDGDYIDIGNSYFGGEIVPLTVKSLAFPA
ncbi:ethanolamine ammonia-lyase reactivating factor EutA [Ferrimonas lipolytica]|uniref:Ethanolamine ammonia-lyase reactivating factor EutA n=1 Tax=Ferrimonas lipolytica TaxID=2724191 RepID=A0A6H1UBW2_9GAMM|nr:ethanolamine ammonia-lyase reactivating factor EutA [Ferrimonas lipolytica]QIZ75696.1 ethanolamine ammonia-lyase reactivating factor EutA [Ferrimonas lipolytica]